MRGLFLFILFCFFILIDFFSLSRILVGINHIVLIVGFVSLFVFSNSKNKFSSLSTFYLGILFFTLLLVFSSFSVRSLPFSGKLIAFIFFILPFIIFYLGSHINWTDYDTKIFMKLYIFVVFLISIVNLINFYFSNSNFDIRNFSIIEGLLFVKELSKLSTLVVIAIVFRLYLNFNRSTNKPDLLIYFSLFLLFFLSIKKSLLTTALVFLVYFFSKGKFTVVQFLKTFFLISCLGLISFFFLNKIGLFDFLVQNIDDTLLYETSRDPDEHVRWVMYISSFKIATTYFPFGSGLATFGSLLSVIFYSPLYYEYGINLIGMNSEADVQNGAHTLLDTFWPHVIAESGYLGTVIYITLFFFPLQLSRKYLDTRLKFLTVSVLLVIFIEGFFLYTPEIPIFILLYSGFLSLVIFSKIKSN